MHHSVMVGSASAMLAACDRLKEERATENGSECFPTVAVILASLAAEVGMKALICRRTASTTRAELRKHLPEGASGHDLEMLFNQLTLEERKAIRLRMVDHLCAGPIVHLYSEASQNGALLAEGEEIEVDLELLPFDQELHRARLCFEQWRYSYESESLFTNASFIDALARSVVEQVKLQPA